MPSLKALEDFKSSFNKIGREELVMEDKGLPFDDLPLPENEPEGQSAPTPVETEAPADLPETSADDDFMNFGDIGDLLGGNAAEPPPPSEELFGGDDLNSVLDTIPDDFSEEPAQEEDSSTIPEEDFNVPPGLYDDSISAESEDDSFSGDDNFAFDDDLAGDSGLPADDNLASDDSFSGEDNFALDDSLSGEDSFALDDNFAGDDSTAEDASLPDMDFATDEFETAPEAGEDEAASTEDSGFGGSDIDLDEMPDFSSDFLAEQTESEDSSAESAVSDESFDLGELPDFGEALDAGSETPHDADELPAGEFLSEDFSFDQMPGEDEAGFDMPESTDSPEPFASSEPFGSGEDLDLTGSDDSFGFSESEPGEPIDSDGFDMGGEFPDLEDVADEPEDSFDKFNIDNDIPDTKDDEIPEAQQDSDEFESFTIPGIDDVASSKPAPSAAKKPGEPEEIALTEDEVAKIKETLASYPLNLRIACQQLIVEEMVAPDLMVNLLRILTTGGSAKEAADLAGKILGKPVSIPKGYEKKTGAELEEEQASFPYIFVHNFLPVLRVFMGIAIVVVSLGYLIWNFVYQPLRAESIYRRGYEQIGAGAYGRARDLFEEAFKIKDKKKWFYSYAEAFRDERQYLYAEEKYDQLLAYTASKNKRYIPEKKAVLDYAALETYYLRNYSKADTLLRRHILDYSVWDKEALLALGDNSLAWGDVEKEHYEDAREAYAKYMERYGRSDPILERMLRYFIRTDNLGEVLPLQAYFMASTRRKIEASSLAELGGYLLDKQTEEIRGVPNQYIQQIGGIRDILLRAVSADPLYPESYYHLSRYYNLYRNTRDEELTLGRAIQAFDFAKTETSQRLGYRIEALRRYAEIHVQRREFFRAEEYLIRGVQLYEDGLSRRVITASPAFGKLYADLGDLEFFVKDGNALAALDYYRRSELNGYSPPELQYRMGAAYYQLRRWPEALDHFAAASFPQPFNRKILYALGNVSYLRGNYFAAQGYYDRLLEILESDRARFPLLGPTNNNEQLELTERIMVVQNNLAITLEALALRTGDNSYRSRALGLYSESERAWDILTRNPDSMVRLRPSPDIIAPGINPAYINVQNSLYPVPGFEPYFFLRIDRDVLEPSIWEELAPQGYRLSEGLSTGR